MVGLPSPWYRCLSVVTLALLSWTAPRLVSVYYVLVRLGVPCRTVWQVLVVLGT